MSPKQENKVETVPVIKEQVIIDKRVVDTAKVRITKKVKERDVQFDVTEEKDEVHIERVPIDRVTDVEPTARHEGDTLIIPVLREEIVIKKKLILVEEIRITKRKNEVTRPEKITLREEEVSISRNEINENTED